MSEITTTLGALLHAEEPLKRLAAMRLPAKTAYQLARLCKLTGERVQEFHDLREKLIRDLGEEREPTPNEAQTNGGQPVTEVAPGNRLEFFTRVQELAAVEVTIACVPLTLDALASVDVSADELNALGSLISITEDASA